MGVWEGWVYGSGGCMGPGVCMGGVCVWEECVYGRGAVGRCRCIEGVCMGKVCMHPTGTIKNSNNIKKINIAIPEPPLFMSRKALRSSDHNTFTIMLPHLQ